MAIIIDIHGSNAHHNDPKSFFMKERKKGCHYVMFPGGRILRRGAFKMCR